MANEITLTSANDLTYAAMIMEDSIIDALYANNNLREFARYKSLVGLPSKANDFPTTPKLTASTVAEATDLTNTAFNTGVATITAGEVGIMVEPTDLLQASDIVEQEYYANELGKAVAEKWTTDFTALSSGFTTQVGSTTVDLTEAIILDSITTLEVADVPAPYKVFAHPQQKRDLVASVGSTITPAAAQGTGFREVLNDLGAAQDGMLGQLYGVEWRTNTTVPTANAGADRLGAIVNPDRAIGFVEKWPVRMELERNASLRSTEIVVTSAYGVGEIDDTSGVGILSDA